MIAQCPQRWQQLRGLPLQGPREGMSGSSPSFSIDTFRSPRMRKSTTKLFPAFHHNRALLRQGNDSMMTDTLITRR